MLCFMWKLWNFCFIIEYKRRYIFGAHEKKLNPEPELTPKENNTKSKNAAKIKKILRSINTGCSKTMPKKEEENYRIQFKSLA